MRTHMQEEAVNNYLLWELSKPFIRSFIVKHHVHQNKIKQIIHNIAVNISGSILTFEEKLDLVRYFSHQSNRANLFEKCTWIKKDYPVHGLGTVLPVCGDLPPNIITRPFSDVIEYVKKKLNKPTSEKSIKYIADLMKIPSILKEFPIIVIEPATLQRNIRVMENYYGVRRWNIAPTTGYIEDGNHRATAMVIVNNLESIPCYVGKKC